MQSLCFTQQETEAPSSLVWSISKASRGHGGLDRKKRFKVTCDLEVLLTLGSIISPTMRLTLFMYMDKRNTCW